MSGRFLHGLALKSLERFADLVRRAVFKLKAEGLDGELGEGTFHSLFVKMLTDRQVESYIRWLRENRKDRSVVTLREWLNEELRSESTLWKWPMELRLSPEEVLEMEARLLTTAFETELCSMTVNSNKSKETFVPTPKPPCVHCGRNHELRTVAKPQGKRNFASIA